MENILGQSAQIIVLLTALFFAQHAINSLFHLYLRYLDRLGMDKEEVRNLARNSVFALFFIAIAGLFNILPFIMALDYLLCVVVIFLVFKINGILKVIKNI